MPYRALLFTLVTVTIALVAVTLWASAISPMLAHDPVPAPATAPHDPGPTPDRSLQILFKGTLTLSFILVCLLFIVGILATSREWAKVHTSRQLRLAKAGTTTYVDAWKIAGERMEPPPTEDHEGPRG